MTGPGPGLAAVADDARMEESPGGSRESDRELMARLAAGDREALAPLMGRHYRRIYRIALGYLRNPDDALDAVQETFVKAYQNARRAGTASPKPGPGSPGSRSTTRSTVTAGSAAGGPASLRSRMRTETATPA